MEAYEIAYRNNPELLKDFRKRDEAKLEEELTWFLHERGYTVFNMNRLSWPEVITLLNGAARASEKSKPASGGVGRRGRFR